MSDVLNPLDHPICFMLPRRLTPFSAWHEHIPFAMLLVDLLRPHTIVELGTQYGDSYCAFCQAVKELNLDTRCYAIDTWKGDPHAGFYGPEVLADLRAHHDPLYGSFSRLIQSTFDEALQHFADGTIDLLHIDGYHTYEAVKHDFESWLPKMSSRGVVLLHDTNVPERDFGVKRFWDEIKLRYPHFEFLHGHGLGVLAVGEVRSKELQKLLTATGKDAARIREFFFHLGHRLTLQVQQQGLKQQVMQLTEKEQALQAQLQAERERLKREKEQVERALQAQFQAEKEQLLGLLRAEQERLTQELAEKERVVHDLSAQLAKREEAVRQLEELLAQIQAEQQAEREAFEAKLQTLAAEREQLARQLEGQIARLKAEQERLTQQLVEKEQAVHDLSAQLAKREQVLKRLLSSKSWRLTAPLRWFYTKFRLCGKLFGDLFNPRVARSQQKQVTPGRDSLGGLLLIVGAFKMTLSHPGQVPQWIHKAWILLKKGGIGELISALRQFLSVQSQIRCVRSDELKNQRQRNEVSLDNGYKNVYLTMLAVAQKKKGAEYVELSDTDLSKENLPVKLIAFYLPQFHPIPENDEWWGRGFTEWTNVSKAVPQFVGHYQPRLPGELGFYDLRVPEVQRRQVELAKKYGIYGFCFYYYWFNGKQLLERPLKQFVSDPEIDFPFCLCWANENWTRRWDGLDHEVLIAQEYSEESDLRFIQDIEPFLRHKRYIRIGQRPLLIVYRANNLPNPNATVKRWREYCQKAGIGDPFLVAAQTLGLSDPRPLGFDAAVEFPPNNLHLTPINHAVQILNPNYLGKIYRYGDMVDQMLSKSMPPYELFKTVCPGWDNEARRPGRGYTINFSTPYAYKHWLLEACRFAMRNPDPDKRLVFINAWNEWGESAYLEPDRRFGYAYLQVTADVLRSLVEENQQDNRKKPLGAVIKRHETCVILHLYYPDLWEEISGYLANLDGDYDLFVSIPYEIDFPLEKILEKHNYTYIYRCKNRGRDIAPFLTILANIYPLRYKYICKIHTKRSPHREDGDLWRKDLLNKILGSREVIQQARRLLDTQPDVGIVAPRGHVLPSTFYLSANENHLKRLATIANVPYNGEKFQFVAGSMFWFRPAAFYPLVWLPITLSDFEPEQGQKDGTLAHAFERFFGLLIQASGFRIAQIGDSMHEENPLNYRFADPTNPATMDTLVAKRDTESL
jgi:lipopolysaccharide biosynthesis protein